MVKEDSLIKEIKLRVVEALQDDAYKGIARIDPEYMRKLGLERGDIDLEDSISIYERGVALKAHCESKLEKAKMKVDKIITQPDGDFKSEPLDEI